MKRIVFFPLFLGLCLLLFNCPGLSSHIDLDIKLSSNEVEPLSQIIVECKNYDLFNYRPINGESKSEYYRNCFYTYVNYFSTNTFLYGINMYHTNKGGVTFKEKLSDNKAIYTVNSNAVTNKIFGEIIKSPDMCDNRTLYLGINNKKLKINYPQNLTLDKTTAKAGDTITVTSTKPFFDTATFSKEKIQNLVNKDYYLVWYTPNKFTSISNVNNPEKMPVPKENIDFDTLTPTSVTFTVPSDAITGTIHVINEGGFVCDPTNDLHLVGNVAGATAYYSTSENLTIIK